ncbi:coleoptile phototropism protein 1-like [Zingiber officinale]|uniref:NPH3 domain-containing protein n=1 Tax=Zingiber officinale TaxID=94328 RepID=A0A8J5G0K9_ZINOF|nr:coleoptile phototropism protein 1-like [Zingiber officinale]XP_042398902.1 coleoptile phototropism protein 1-like [Zingiber officinale]XP_042398903.1 coleoptile phototropism protein 1-like [Zingiber officinale]XP_042398904.1 coleoptile phototropism protein 1-like [Zingiber officinale]XP_042398905.1 coleoptile phototropism protein 1-like [Zingiber officinale]XP_042398906.1 coleoptile phototropism protein 1-like [Zingiber officinale]XP_042398907.1 coleoptile phototropism protein 1-like [Zing
MTTSASPSSPSPSTSPTPSITIRRQKLPSSPQPEDHDHLASADRSWLGDATVQDLDHFANSLAGIKAKGVRPELLGSLLSHYASRWLPELSGRTAPSPEESPTAAWLKKRFLIETLASVLPPEKAALPGDFLLRLLRAASLVGADPSCVLALEARAAAQLDEASLKELMIPAFNHTSGTLLDVAMVLRLVHRFVRADDGSPPAARTGAALARVAKLVDSYLAEAALDSGLTVAAFEELASSLPVHARAMDDGLYRAIDTYIKAHPGTSKQERKTLCRLIDARKLSSEAALHAAQNERLPVRSVIQVLFAEHSKLSRLAEWSGSFNWSSTGRSPSEAAAAGRCQSKRETVPQQQNEVRRLRDEVAKLHAHCHALQAQVDRLASAQRKKAVSRKKGWLACWSCWFGSGDRGGSEAVEKVDRSERSAERPTPARSKQGSKILRTASL